MTRKTRTTVRLPDDRLRAAKTLAAERGTTLTRLIEDARRASLARLRQRPAEPRFPDLRWRHPLKEGDGG